ncbi:MAG TPA: hypothetical protein VHB21_11390 [Minicystis sp.]|nr:hypothetical protein [Minicystis sp.]
MQTATTSSRSTKKPDYLLARIDPKLVPIVDTGAPPTFTAMLGRKQRLTLKGHGWHRVPREVGEVLRREPLHDANPSGPRRFNVLEQHEFDEFVKRERARIDQEQEAAAKALAEKAVQAELEARAVEMGTSTHVVDAVIADLGPEPKQARRSRKS